MRTPVDPRASGEDLTAKARIRNAAMDLYAEYGEDRTSMRAIAAAAGVTVGLLVHHFGTKDRLRDAVEQLVVDYFAQAIAQAPATGTPAEIGAARDAAVQEMLAANPAVVNYLRRAVLNPIPSRLCSPDRRSGAVVPCLEEPAVLREVRVGACGEVEPAGPGHDRRRRRRGPHRCGHTGGEAQVRGPQLEELAAAGPRSQAAGQETGCLHPGCSGGQAPPGTGGWHHWRGRAWLTR